MKKIFVVALLLAAVTASAGNKGINVIFETDYGNDADDAIALDVLCKYADMGKINLLGVSTHRAGAYVCPAVDGSLAWYGHPKVPVAISPMPVWRPNDGRHYSDSVALKRNAKGQLAFRGAKDFRYITSVAFYRKTLAAMPDNSVVIVSVGFGTNLAMLLESPADDISPLTGRELVARKVKLLSIMMGCYREKPFAEYNVACDIPAMRKVVAEWPGEIVENPFEIGEKAVYDLKTLNANLSWASENPLLTACNALHPDGQGQCSYDVMSVIYLIHPEMFTISERGTISIDERGMNSFTPSASGKHRYLTTTSEQNAKLMRLVEKITAMKPKSFKGK